MKKIGALFTALLIFSGCASTVTGKYGIDRTIDSNNTVTVTMEGGIIDANAMGVVSNGARFNPYVVRSPEGSILETGIKATYYVEHQLDRYTITEGSTADFFLNGESDKIQIKAVKVDTKIDVTSIMGTTVRTKRVVAWFPITPEELKRIANADTVRIRVTGPGGHEDFPRQPNRQLVENFLSNIKMFYEKEVKIYLTG